MSDGERDYKQSYKITTRTDYLVYVIHISAPSVRGARLASDLLAVMKALEPMPRHAWLLNVLPDCLRR